MWKRYKNADEGVVLAAIQIAVDSDPSTESMAPPRSAHVQLDDVPRALDPVEDEGEFLQHDSVATVMMMLPAQGFTKALRWYDRGV